MENLQHELVLVVDFGAQYAQLIARRVRECNVYCEVHPYNMSLDQIREMNPKGIILTGGPASCYEPGAATCSEDRTVFMLKIRRLSTMVFSPWVFLSSVFAMAISSWQRNWAASLPMRVLPVNMERPRFPSITKRAFSPGSKRTTSAG